jgi:hypothetical protein
MTRVNVYRHDETDGRILDGWFDPDKAELIKEGSRWDGNNNVGVLSDIPRGVGGEYLYRTAGGRWIRHLNARNYFNGPMTYEFITDEQAREWLVRAEQDDDVIEQYFGEVEEEHGPGRPEVGGRITTRFGDDLLARVDALANERGRSRADTIRFLVAQALD